MNIKLLTTTDPNNKVVKTYTENLSIDGELKDACSILNPSMIIEVGTLPTSNYAYIADFSRYYYIDDITVLAPAKVENNVTIRNMLVEINLSIDVLMTYKDQIKNLDAVTARQEFKYNTFIHDDALKVNQNPQIVTQKFPGGFANPNAATDPQHFYLIVAG